MEEARLGLTPMHAVCMDGNSILYSLICAINMH